MISVRSLSAGLLFLLFGWNLYLGIITKPDPSFLMYIVFCVVFFTLVVLLITKIRFAELIVFIISIAILFIYPLMVDFKNLNPWSSGIMAGIDVLVIICCSLMLLLKL